MDPHIPSEIEQTPIPVKQIISLVSPIRSRNEGRLDAIVKSHRESQIETLHKTLKEIGGDRGIPAGSVGLLLSNFLEWQDVQSMRESGYMDLFVPPTEEEAKRAKKIFILLKNTPLEDLVKMGDVLITKMWWTVGNYIEGWRTHKKFKEIYPKGISAVDALKIADGHAQLMKGIELPPGFSLSFMEEIREKIMIIQRNSLHANLEMKTRNKVGPKIDI